MRRVLIYPILCLSLAASAACSRVNDESKQMAGGDTSKRDQIEATGCLTSNAETNQFVLTANSNALSSLTNRAAAGEAQTFHYQLVGGNDLSSYVGREVIVNGSISGKGKDVSLAGSDESDAPATKSRERDVTPAIEMSHEIEMQVQRLNVASITPTGSACQIGQEDRR
jgi:hypothetical protein